MVYLGAGQSGVAVQRLVAQEASGGVGCVLGLSMAAWIVRVTGTKHRAATLSTVQACLILCC